MGLCQIEVVLGANEPDVPRAGARGEEQPSELLSLLRCEFAVIEHHFPNGAALELLNDPEFVEAGADLPDATDRVAWYISHDRST